jgi:hypothetical protein
MQVRVILHGIHFTQLTGACDMSEDALYREEATNGVGIGVLVV